MNSLVVNTLPDIEMYGGDTTPWDAPLIKPSGADYKLSDLSGIDVTLYIAPFHSVISADGVVPSGAVITKTATLASKGAHFAVAQFEFSQSDTISLRGKYVYQIEVTNGQDTRISQGYLYIKPNLRIISGDSA